ncbi:hypothetical protein [Ferrimicrobium sp.]|uniref:hypothetical protein n=1 Tax=Ferrimicrobium sp. TaxID=2926050 RepID=UPI002607C5D7|nr:hypothetical protein [Ferrimicrobium sp.]
MDTPIVSCARDRYKASPIDQLRSTRPQHYVPQSAGWSYLLADLGAHGNSPIMESAGSSLFTTLVAGTVGIILLIVTVQSVTAIIEWVQLNALADHAAILAASDLAKGQAYAITNGDNSLESSGIMDSALGIHWTITGQSVTLTLGRSVSMLAGKTTISAHAIALVN